MPIRLQQNDRLRLIAKMQELLPSMSSWEAFKRAVNETGLGLSTECSNKSIAYHYAKLARGEKVTSPAMSPLDSIRLAERQILEAIRGLEAERDGLHDRIIQIDNTIAKYRNFNSNGK